MIKVYLAYANQKVMLMVADNSRLLDAIKNEALYLAYLKEVTVPMLGIFGEQVDFDYRLQAGDRIELYLPLLIDPMEERKQRVKASRRKNK